MRDSEAIKFLNWHIRRSGLRLPPANQSLLDKYREETRPQKDWRRLLLKKHGVTMKDLRGKARNYDIVYPRQLMAFLLHKKGWTLQRVGDYLNIAHATVLHSKKVIENYMDTDEKKRNEIKGWIIIMNRYEEK